MYIQPPHPSQKNVLEIPLGRFILEGSANEYQDPNIEIEIMVTNNCTNSEYLHRNQRNTQKELPLRYISGRYTSHHSRETLVKGTRQCIYQVRDPEVVLRKALDCGGTAVQNWLREKAQLRQNVHMVVGLWTLIDPRVVEKTTYRRVLRAAIVDPFSILSSLAGFRMPSEYTIQMTFSIHSTKEKKSISISQAIGECVWVVQYQRVERSRSTCGNESRLTEPHWKMDPTGFTEQGGFRGEQQCPFKKMRPIGFNFHSLPYTVVHLFCKERGIRVGCVFRFPQLGLQHL